MSTNFTGNTGQHPPTSAFSQPVMGGTAYLNITSSQAIKATSGILTGIFVNSSSSGTLKLYDNAAATGTVICNTFSPTVGWNPLPVMFQSGLYATVGGTLDCTFIYS
jgi:hypothetical protein